MLRSYLVDDEPLASERLGRLLRETGRVEVIGSTSKPEEAVTALITNPPDICFLDIEMPRMNGFEVLSRINAQPIVIFTTAYDSYALKAFEVNSLDYLLKPVDPKQLDRALSKVARLRVAPPESQLNMHALIQRLADSLRPAQPDYANRIASRLGDRLWFIDLPLVTHFLAEDKLTYAVADGKRYCIGQTIFELENKLDPKGFIRIHRASIVNVNWIREIAALPGGGLNLRLKDEARTELTVARDRAKVFKERLCL